MKIRFVQPHEFGVYDRSLPRPEPSSNVKHNIGDELEVADVIYFRTIGFSDVRMINGMFACLPLRVFEVV